MVETQAPSAGLNEDLRGVFIPNFQTLCEFSSHPPLIPHLAWEIKNKCFLEGTGRDVQKMEACNGWMFR